LRGLCRLEPHRLGLDHRIAEADNRVRRHRRVIGVAALLIGLHDRAPFLQVQREASTWSRPAAPLPLGRQHHHPGREGEADQPFCGAEISTSTPVAAMSTQMQPEAMQSSTISAPTSCAAAASA
jgi:hypothetical protein